MAATTSARPSPYEIRLLAEATVNGNTLVVREDDTNNLTWSHLHAAAWWAVAGPEDILPSNHNAWNIVSASSWAMKRRNAGLSGETLVFYTQGCPDTPGSCQRAESLYIATSHQKKKYIIVHELGHAVADASNNWNNTDIATVGDEGSCVAADGTWVKKELQSNSANEGIAWYYSAVAFNQTDQSDCEIARTGMDFDQDGTPGESEELAPSCEGDPVAQNWANLNYIGNTCTGTLADRATMLDWIRAWWDLDQGQGLSTVQVFDIWDEANPHSWDENGGGLFATDDPFEQIETAAGNLGFATEWAAVSNNATGNGINR